MVRFMAISRAYALRAGVATYRWWKHHLKRSGVLTLISRFGVVPTVATLVGACFALSLHIVPSQPVTAPTIRTVSIPNPVVANTHTRLLDYRISDRDLNRYQTAFDLQAKGEWKQASAVIKDIEDDTLQGALLAQRYLHEAYESRYDELASWLRHYSDMPEAPRVHALARRKSPVSASVPPVSSSKDLLKGYGTRDGMGRQSPPPRFHDGLDAWARGDYVKAATAFASAASSPKLSHWNLSATHFWAYRAYDKLSNRTKAREHLALAAAHPFTFYGALAAHASGEMPDLSNDLPRLEDAVVSLPAVKRAAYYSALGRYDAAEAEIRTLYSKAPASIRPQLMTISAELNLPGLQMRMAQALNSSALEAGAAAFPTPGWVPEYDLSGDAVLLFAIARQESGFNPEALNPDSGATGLLQVMPNTARYVINQYRLNEVEHTQKSAGGMPLYSVARLSDPVVNMVIGQQYLNYLSEKEYIGGNLIQLLAAYNAGPGNLLEWQERYDNIKDPLLFVERIPFKETRHYVQQVMCNYMIYDELMDGSGQQAAALLDGIWPTVQPSAPRYAAAQPREIQ